MNKSETKVSIYLREEFKEFDKDLMDLSNDLLTVMNAYRESSEQTKDLIKNIKKLIKGALK